VCRIGPSACTECVPEPDYLSFEQRDGCWSWVGRQQGKQVISLEPGCGVGAAIHEIGHAVGLWHEHSRADRDDHVEILWDNIIPGTEHNFYKRGSDGEDIGEYDFASIMHYPAMAFSSNGQPTIRAKDGRTMGQRASLSPGDIAALRRMYPPLSW